MSNIQVKVVEDKGKTLDNRSMEMENSFISPNDLKRTVKCSPSSPPLEKSRKIAQNKSLNHSSDPRICQDVESECDFKEDEELISLLEVIPYLICRICNFEIKHFDDPEPTKLLFHIHSKLQHNSPCLSFDKCNCLSYHNDVIYDHFPVLKDPKF